MSNHFLKDEATVSHNGNGVYSSELLNEKHPNCSDLQSEKGDTMPSDAAPTMDFEKATLRELLDYFLRTRDPAAWTEFNHRTSRTIRGVIANRLGRRNRDDVVDDLEQETYLKLVRNDYKALQAAIWTDDNDIFGYVKVVATHATVDRLRKPHPDEESLDSHHDIAAVPSPDLGM